jgi:hypothetical protein
MQRIRTENGAVGVFTAILMAALLGMLGLAVDVGAMYDERRQLSNGADAAVLAIAEDCALGIVSCDTATATVTARSFANANASDGAAFIERIVLDTAAKTVRVETSTLDAEGNRVFAPYFAQVLGWNGSTVYASASALWGYPKSMRNVLPLIISECEVDKAAFGVPTTLYFHDGNNADPCNATAGMDADGDGKLPGGFGWLVADGADCSIVTLETNDWVSADPGSSPSNGCAPPDLSSLIGEPVPLPIFIDIDGLGAGGAYRIFGFILFQIDGYNFGGAYKLNPPCSGDERCVSGHFTTGVVHDGIPGGPNNGIVIVKLTG